MTKKESCKLYRSFYEIIHPSISRKNISEYKIVFSEEIIPVQIFYPRKEITLDNIVIYIQGNNAYNGYYENLALETDQLIILLDKSIMLEDEKYFESITYIIDEAKQAKINSNDISIMSDFKGTNIILSLESKLNNKKYLNIKKILLSPPESDLENCNLDNTLVLSNNEEMKVNKNIDYKLIKESIYDFTIDKDAVANEGIYLKIKDFIEGE